MPLNNFPELPVTDVLSDLGTCLQNNNTAILRAPTGAGKTTLVPLYLHDSTFINGKILILEPRRLATFAAATRMAEIMNEPLGKTVGYRMQMDSKVSPETKIEVVTEGILARMVQSDPELAGIGLIIFDEFHERSLQGDLGLALSLQSQELRDTPLKLLIMSATLNTATLSKALAAPVITSKGFSYPVTTHYLDKPLKDKQFHSICQGTVSLIRKALSETSGSLLVFLPGTREIRQVYQGLCDYQLPDNTEVFPLSGDMSLDNQKQAIASTENNKRKIVLATNIAETSLTIEGIRIVVDSGMTRRAVYDPGTGMSKLETRRLSLSSADQRKGRAGRLEPGECYRLWTKHEHQQLESEDTPEVLEADLTSLALELYAWGCHTPDELFWLNLPPAGRYQQAISLLLQLKALEPINSGSLLRITRHGKAMATLGTHPRIANLLLLSREYNMLNAGCRLAAILSERDILRGNKNKSADLGTRLNLIEENAGRGLHKSDLSRIKRLTQQWKKRLRQAQSAPPVYNDTARLLIAAYPDRVAKRRSNSGAYLTASGQGAELIHDDPLITNEFLVIPEMGGHSNRRNASIFLAYPVEKQLIYEELSEQIEESEEIKWDPRLNRVAAFNQDKLGAIIIEQQVLPAPDQEKITAAMVEGIKCAGLNVLPWNKKARQLKARIIFLNSCNPEFSGTPLPDVSDRSLENTLTHWLAPYLASMTKLDQLSKLDMTDILISQLSWEQQQILNREAPESLKVPSGSNIAINYDKPEEPTLSVRLQELFGLENTPVIGFNSVPLTIELLSPAHRPVQITRDLKSFWQNTYHEVKKDLKGRYPKHYWPEDPTLAEATRYTRPRR